MTDIEMHLHHKPSDKPRRNLSAGFTNRTMAQVQARSRQTMIRRVASIITKGIPMKLRHMKHTGAVMAAFAVIVLGSTTYAAIRWQGSEGAADFGGITKLANGDTRFWVHAHDCADEQGKQYFDIKAGSKVTPEDITDMVAGTCENLDIMSIFPNINMSGTLPQGISYDQPDGYNRAIASTEVNTQYYMAGGIIKNIDRQHNALTYATIGEADRTVPLNSDVKIFKSGQPQTLESIADDQTAILILQGQGTFAQANKNSFLPGSTVYGIEITHHQPYNSTLEGKDFTRLVPKKNDKNAPTGKENPDAIKYYQDPKNLVEEHPLH
jgi:hypothetical protein